VLFPITILRARVIQHHQKGVPKIVSNFISHTFASVREVGDLPDAEAWVLPDCCWDTWETRGSSGPPLKGNAAGVEGGGGGTGIRVAGAGDIGCGRGVGADEGGGKPQGWRPQA
jgi:hypothetical protein